MKDFYLVNPEDNSPLDFEFLEFLINLEDYYPSRKRVIKRERKIVCKKRKLFYKSLLVIGIIGITGIGFRIHIFAKRSTEAVEIGINSIAVNNPPNKLDKVLSKILKPSKAIRFCLNRYKKAPETTQQLMSLFLLTGGILLIPNYRTAWKVTRTGVTIFKLFKPKTKVNFNEVHRLTVICGEQLRFYPTLEWVSRLSAGQKLRLMQIFNLYNPIGVHIAESKKLKQAIKYLEQARYNDTLPLLKHLKKCLKGLN